MIEPLFYFLTLYVRSFSYLRANYLQGGIPSEIGELVHLTILYALLRSHYHLSFDYLCAFKVFYLSICSSNNALKLQGLVEQPVEGHNSGFDWKPYSPPLSVSFLRMLQGLLLGEKCCCETQTDRAIHTFTISRNLSTNFFSGEIPNVGVLGTFKSSS